MDKLSYNQKARCQGCAALKAGPGTYTCALGLPVKFALVDNTATQPAPDNVKCHKPKTTKQLLEIKALADKANA